MLVLTEMQKETIMKENSEYKSIGIGLTIECDDVFMGKTQKKDWRLPYTSVTRRALSLLGFLSVLFC